ncbi:hypothetical protein TVAG_370920 [Trichomonas vaginalis G3]|uniref:Cullin neddylation domain-containing protein n=1 Tax=Trichomonas vaginalis (strain ATCC PRA-98 / G3) TaxID=412133 RepID=A2FHP4_TRIV3|nr:Cullin homology domain family [Trichomonas vaginalis G3]EAX95588.1 hypothetical protein TVAG_370920 [Trichomonas vaginalis G3]KAI5486912.1 Cullin homology domain family [Trichomonas vaginalis G3]|eukprot:XP_001308518.1 hypothetical protein [Trichomonas vaginalis G3]
MNQEIIDLIMNFIKSPTTSSFDEVYMAIWNAIEQKVDLKPSIMHIIDELTQVPTEGDTDLQIFYNKLETYRRNVEILMSFFTYYDSTLGDKENETIAALATAQILSKYFYNEATIVSLQKCVTEIFSSFLRNNVPIPKELTKISLYINRVSIDLYVKVFSTTFQTELKFYLQSISFSETQNTMDEINLIYSTYMRIYEGIDTSLPPFTKQHLRELFNALVTDNELERITATQSIKEAIETNTIGTLFKVIQIGRKEWFKKFANSFKEYLKNLLESFPESSFPDFCEFTSKAYNDACVLNQESFGGTLSQEIKSSFVRYLDEQQFSDKLCTYHDQNQEPLQTIAPLCKFLDNDGNFSDQYARYLTRRLLSNTTTVEKENQLYTFFKDNGVNLEDIGKILDDFGNPPRMSANINGTEVNIFILNTFNWSVLKKINYTLPKFFDYLFKTALAQSDFDSKFKVINPTDNCSSIEFSNGTTTFVLGLLHACIVHLILEQGGITFQELKDQLKSNDSDSSFDSDLKVAMKSLIDSKIIEQKGDSFVFLGPPKDTIGLQDESTEIPKRTVESVHFNNCNDQIEAATYKFLKSRRSATVDEIVEAVYNVLRPKFDPPREDIEKCLNKLVEREYIIPHGGLQNSYRISKH